MLLLFAWLSVLRGNVYIGLLDAIAWLLSVALLLLLLGSLAVGESKLSGTKRLLGRGLMVAMLLSCFFYVF